MQQPLPQSTPAFERLRQQMFTLVCLALIASGVVGLFGYGFDARLPRLTQVLLSVYAVSSVWTLLALYGLKIPFLNLERGFIWFFISNFLLRSVAENWTPSLRVGEFILFTDSGIVLLTLGIFIALPVKEALRYALVLYLGFLLIPWIAIIFVNHNSSPLWVLLIRNQLVSGLIIGLIHVLGVSKSAWYQEQERSRLLNDIAHKDTLTGIANRRGLLEEIRQHKQFALVLFDLDHFKKINDSFGHDTGDIALKNAAFLAQKQLRETDFIARWGGEEFLVILPNASLEAARAVAERIRTAFLETREPSFTASFGVAHGESSTFESNLKNADAALYQAKESGRNRVMTQTI